MPPPPLQGRPPVALPVALAGVAGVVLWIAASIASGRREAWDADFYWIVAYPVALALAVLLALLFPQRPWRWALALFLFQFVGMAIRNGEIGNLWPLGLIVFAVLSVPAMLLAQLTAWLRARLRGEPREGGA